MTENKTDLALTTGPISDNRELAVTGSQAEKMAEIQAAVVLAKNFKRNEDKVFAALMKSCTRPSFADGASYSFPRGGNTISGPSIKLAREAQRLWGNMRSGLDVLLDTEGDGTEENPGIRKIRGWAWDLQTNAFEYYEDTFRKLIQRKIRGVTEWVVPDERDLRELTFRRGAILKRNAILSLMPPDFIDDALNTAKSTLAREVKEDPDAARKRVVVGFQGIGVSVEMLEELLGHLLSQSSPAEIASLREVYASIRDGNTTWKDHLPEDEATATLAPEDILGKPEPPQEPAKKPEATEATLEKAQRALEAKRKTAGIQLSGPEPMMMSEKDGDEILAAARKASINPTSLWRLIHEDHDADGWEDLPAEYKATILQKLAEMEETA